MKLLYLASTLLATAAITHAQVLVAFAVIEFAIEILEVETGVTSVVELETQFAITAEVAGEEVTFSAETIMAEGVDVNVFQADVTLEDINPSLLNVEDETVEANLRWNQEIDVFGGPVSVQFVTGVAADVDVTVDGAVTFQAEGELAPFGAVIQLEQGYTAALIDNMSSVTFSGP